MPAVMKIEENSSEGKSDPTPADLSTLKKSLEEASKDEEEKSSKVHSAFLTEVEDEVGGGDDDEEEEEVEEYSLDDDEDEGEDVEEYSMNDDEETTATDDGNQTSTIFISLNRNKAPQNPDPFSQQVSEVAFEVNSAPKEEEEVHEYSELSIQIGSSKDASDTVSYVSHHFVESHDNDEIVGSNEDNVKGNESPIKPCYSFVAHQVMAPKLDAAPAKEVTEQLQDNKNLPVIESQESEKVVDTTDKDSNETNIYIKKDDLPLSMSFVAHQVASFKKENDSSNDVEDSSYRDVKLVDPSAQITLDSESSIPLVIKEVSKEKVIEDSRSSKWEGSSVSEPNVLHSSSVDPVSTKDAAFDNITDKALFGVSSDKLEEHSSSKFEESDVIENYKKLEANNYSDNKSCDNKDSLHQLDNEEKELHVESPTEEDETEKKKHYDISEVKIGGDESKLESKIELESKVESELKEDLKSDAQEQNVYIEPKTRMNIESEPQPQLVIEPLIVESKAYITTASSYESGPHIGASQFESESSIPVSYIESQIQGEESVDESHSQVRKTDDSNTESKVQPTDIKVENKMEASHLEFEAQVEEDLEVTASSVEPEIEASHSIVESEGKTIDLNFEEEIETKGRISSETELNNNTLQDNHGILKKEVANSEEEEAGPTFRSEMTIKVNPKKEDYEVEISNTIEKDSDLQDPHEDVPREVEMNNEESLEIVKEFVEKNNSMGLNANKINHVVDSPSNAINSDVTDMDLISSVPISTPSEILTKELEGVKESQKFQKDEETKSIDDMVTKVESTTLRQNEMSEELSKAGVSSPSQESNSQNPTDHLHDDSSSDSSFTTGLDKLNDSRSSIYISPDFPFSRTDLSYMGIAFLVLLVGFLIHFY